MLRIDLLPAYVAQRRLTRQLIVLFTAAFAMIVVGMLGVAAPLKIKADDMTKRAEKAEGYQSQVTSLESQTTTVTGQQPAIDTKIKFVTDVEAYNQAYPKLYRTIAKYTVPTILYSTLSVTGTALSISAYTPNLASLADYLAHIWNDPDLKSVDVSAFPGYRQEYEPSLKTFTMPVLPPGYVAHFKGSSQRVASFVVAGGQVTQILSGDEQAPEQPNESVKPKFDAAHSGFDFTVKAELKAALTAPADPSGAVVLGSVSRSPQ
jgi:hypothetical protein